MEASQYRPAPRFVGLFPFSDAISQLVDKVVGIIGGGFGNFIGEFSTLQGMPHAGLEVAGGMKDLKDALGDAKNPYGKAIHKSKVDSSATTNKFAITWSYLHEKGMKKIAEGSVSFAAMYHYAEGELMNVLNG
jgi:hypothetical protein